MQKVGYLLLLLLGILIYSQLSSGARTKVGRKCRSKDGLGRCTPIKDCPSALSNLHSGLRPRECSRERGIVVVCCLNRKRISEIKCEEYLNSVAAPVSSMALLPFVDERSSSKVTGKEECSVRAIRFIVGGRNAQVDEFPYMTALGYGPKDENRWLCGGTLIAPSFILTAGHCVNRERPQRVLLGDISLKGSSSTRKVVKVSKIFVHPLYKDPKIYNDLALIKLSSPLRFSRSILPACLPRGWMRPEKIFKDLHVSGWGRLGFRENTPDILQTVNLTRVSQKKCDDFFSDRVDKSIRFPKGIVRSHLCAGEWTQAKDSCQGDSGGPLSAKINKPCTHFVLGVVSFGSKYCGNNEPALYTNVQSYLNWIESIVWPRN